MSTETRNFFNEHRIYTLSDIGRSLQSVIAKNYKQPYYIKAEIIKLNYYPRSGHCYPELVEKVDNKIVAQMRAIIWATQYRTINRDFEKMTGEPLKEGISILCLASIEYSPQYGLALYIQHIEPSFTLGEMAKNKLLTIERLKKEGVFDANKRTVFPLIPKRIAIISVETSKGYSDLMITLTQNNWGYKFACQLFPAILQGEKAIKTISEQLEKIKKELTKFDVVVIIRGGGGDAGLSCYDDYQLAKNVATFPIPILSGIGHSTNETVTEMVAYSNKITPTEVGYFLIQQFHNFAMQVEDFQNSILRKSEEILKNSFQNLEEFQNEILRKSEEIIKHNFQRLEDFQNSILRKSNEMIISNFQRLEHTSQLIKLFTKQLIDKEHSNLKNMRKQLELLHPDNILKRGFSITYFKGKAVVDEKELQEDDMITTQFYRGKTQSIIKKST